jgi:hypothetical protein
MRLIGILEILNGKDRSKVFCSVVAWPIF